jgi:DNA-binding transcriptional MerR regulator
MSPDGYDADSTDPDGVGVGAAAAATGLSVRALQFYDRIGLLPAGRDRAGRRRYTPADLSRLQRIRMLTACGVALAEIRRVLDSGTEREPQEIYAAQIAWCEQQELALRAQRTVLESVSWVLRRHPAVAVPSAALTALMNVEETLMRYATLPDTDAPGALTTRETAWHLEVYFRWKAVSIEALLLSSVGVAPASASGLLVGEHWDAYLRFVLGDEPDAELSEAYRSAAEDTRQWPPADKELHDTTREYLELCHRAYCDHGRGRS